MNRGLANDQGIGRDVRAGADPVPLRVRLLVTGLGDGLAEGVIPAGGRAGSVVVNFTAPVVVVGMVLEFDDLGTVILRPDVVDLLGKVVQV